MNPKENFEKFHKDDAATLRGEVQKGYFATAASFALAELASRGATFEELNGANRFLEILTTLSAEKVELKRLPVRQLSVLGANLTEEQLQSKAKELGEKK